MLKLDPSPDGILILGAMDVSIPTVAEKHRLATRKTEAGLFLLAEASEASDARDAATESSPCFSNVASVDPVIMPLAPRGLPQGQVPLLLQTLELFGHPHLPLF